MIGIEKVPNRGAIRKAFQDYNKAIKLNHFLSYLRICVGTINPV